MKRWSIRIFVFLILGAIVNVAVAWACAAWDVGKVNERVSTHLGYGIGGWGRHTLGTTTVELFPSSQIEVALSVHPWQAWIVRPAAQRMLHEGAVSPVPAIECFGWPLRALWFRAQSGRRIAGSSPEEFEPVPGEWCIKVRGIRQGPIRETRALPVRPLWRGLIPNTVFYAVVLWLLFAGPFVVRRWRRIRRGLCPKCAYDLRGTRGGPATACPECGAAFEKHKAEDAESIEAADNARVA